MLKKMGEMCQGDEKEKWWRGRVWTEKLYIVSASLERREVMSENSGVRKTSKTNNGVEEMR